MGERGSIVARHFKGNNLIIKAGIFKLLIYPCGLTYKEIYNRNRVAALLKNVKGTRLTNQNWRKKSLILIKKLIFFIYIINFNPYF